MFGDAPEDQRAGSVVRAAIEEMTAAGALFSPMAVEDPPKEADGVAIIRHEFKFDLDAYFAKTPKAPVRSLAEVLEKHLHHPSLENAFRTSADVPTLDSDAYRAIVARNAGLRQALIDVMDRAGVVALVYPTLRRTVEWGTHRGRAPRDVAHGG